MVNKSILIEDVSEALINGPYPELTKPDIQRAIDLTLDHIGEAIAEGRRVEIRGFGSFTPRDLPGRSGRNPKTGEPVIVPPKRTVHFKSGLELRDQVDAFAHGQGNSDLPYRRASN